MPNWCENDLWISGPDVDVILEFVKTKGKELDKTYLFDFNEILPMPKELEDTAESSFDNLGMFALGGPDVENSFSWVLRDEKIIALGIKTLDELREHYRKTFPQTLERGAISLRAYQATGFTSWYHWCNANWGTKWNSANAQVRRQKSALLFKFDTAWSPPLPVIAALAARFPKHKFTHKYYECGGGFQGRVVYMKGVVKEQDSSKYSGRRGG